MRRLLAIALLAATPAAAQDCSRFADPMAYNACLARQGPAARVAHVGKAPVASIGSVPTARRAAAAPHAPVIARGRRSEMVFSVRK